MAPIAIYFIIWAVVHSILASLSVKSWTCNILGNGVRRWYRLFYVLMAVLTLMPLAFIYLLQPDQILYRISSPWSWLMRIGQGLSLVLLVLATWRSGLLQFIGLSQALIAPEHFTGNLVTTGVFRCVRHPLYLFGSLLLWLSPIMTLNQLVLSAFITLYFIVGSFHEERILLDEFGEAYQRYRQQVPRFIPVPGRCYQSEGTE
jgi:protein-S-isoprenylcysteine O-methyltransferase Ste14